VPVVVEEIPPPALSSSYLHSSLEHLAWVLELVWQLEQRRLALVLAFLRPLIVLVIYHYWQ
jgi:hypothetical protein